MGLFIMCATFFGFALLAFLNDKVIYLVLTFLARYTQGASNGIVNSILYTIAILEYNEY